MTTVDELAQVIREVDGKNSLGAGALAEVIIAKLPHIAARQPVHAVAGLHDASVFSKDALLEKVRAARQPVGEPAMYQVRPRSFPIGEGWREVSKRQFDDRGEPPGYPEAEWDRRMLYAAPPVGSK